MRRIMALAGLNFLLALIAGPVVSQDSGSRSILILDPQSRFLKSGKLVELGGHLRSLAGRYPSLDVLDEPGLGVNVLRIRAHCKGSSPDCLAKMARVAKASQLLHSQIRRLPGRYLIVMRLVDAKNGKVLEQSRQKARRDPESIRNALLKGWVDIQGPLIRSQLKVVSNVGAADVFLDSRKIGQTPLVLTKDLGRGTHLVEVRMDGYESFHQKIEVTSGGSHRVDAKLGQIKVKDSSSGGIGEAGEVGTGHKLGGGKDEGGIWGKALASGEKQVSDGEGQHAGQDAGKREALKISGVEAPGTDNSFLPGEHDQADPTADEDDRVTPIYKQWWFWTAIGVVVAGGVTGLVLGLPDDGGIPAGKGRVTIEFW